MNRVLANHRQPFHPPPGVFFVIPALALLSVMFASTIRETALICWNSEDYSHGLLLPFMSAYFIFTDWPTIKSTLERTDPAAHAFSWSGLFLLGIGMIVYILGAVASLHFLKWLALFPSVIGFLFLLLSRPRAQVFAIPILLNYMAKPLPDALVPKLFFPLQVLAAKVSAFVLDVMNVPVFLRGNIIEIPGMQLMVEEACSGLRSMMALLTVAVVVVYSVRLPWFAQIILIAGSAVVAVLLNVVRVAATGILAHFVDPALATGFFHTFSGLVVFILGLIVLFGFAKVLQKLFGSATDQNGAVQRTEGSR